MVSPPLINMLSDTFKLPLLIQYQDLFATYHLGTASARISFDGWWLHGSFLAGLELHY